MPEQFLVVLGVLGALIGMLWFLRKKGLAVVNLPAVKKRGSAKQLEVLERLPLTANHSLHLVRAGETFLVIGVSPSSCQALGTLPELQGGFRSQAAQFSVHREG